jgi:signal transduction histidine kinase
MSAQGCVLVIDGDSGDREACRRALEPAGYVVEAVATGQEGMHQVREGQFDLVLLGSTMPDMRGVDLLPLIHERDPDMVCIVIAHHVTVEQAIQAIQAGAYDLVSEPFATNLLVATVGQGLEKRRHALEDRKRRVWEQEADESARARAELERLERFKAAFIRVAAHQLRSPVTAIQSLLTTLIKGYAAPDEQQDFLQRAFDRSQDLLKMVDDLVSLAAVSAEQQVMRREILPLADVLMQVLPVLQAEAEEKKITCIVEIRQPAKVKAHPEQMSQLWINLISNAIQYTPPGGQVRIGLEVKDQWAVGTVEDTGIGIAAEYQSQIFQEFYRTPQAKQMKPRGTGLGLPLVKQIVEGHHGIVEVESASGKGSRFTFRLPLAALPSDQGPGS